MAQGIRFRAPCASHVVAVTNLNLNGYLLTRKKHIGLGFFSCSAEMRERRRPQEAHKQGEINIPATATNILYKKGMRATSSESRPRKTITHAIRHRSIQLRRGAKAKVPPLSSRLISINCTTTLNPESRQISFDRNGWIFAGRVRDFGFSTHLCCSQSYGVFDLQFLLDSFLNSAMYNIFPKSSMLCKARGKENW